MRMLVNLFVFGGGLFVGWLIGSPTHVTHAVNCSIEKAKCHELWNDGSPKIVNLHYDCPEVGEKVCVQNKTSVTCAGYKGKAAELEDK